VGAEYVRARLGLADEALAAGRPAAAVEHLTLALRYPPNLGEARHPLAPATHVEYAMGLALEAAGDPDAARSWWRRAAADREPSEMTLPQALARRRLGDAAGADAALRRLLATARRRAREVPRVDYFATSLPDMLIFDDDLTRRRDLECAYLAGLARLGLGQARAAAALFRRVLELDPSHPGAAGHLGRPGTPPARPAPASARRAPRGRAPA
jgi:tetratricopeptide (TPR) repeat protein